MTSTATAPTTTRTREPTYAYRPALDGVRALAVTAVLLFHGGVPFLPGGFLGVDAFFLLSGFLITSLLLAEHAASGRIRLGAFWGRRARRLLPALLVLLVAVAVAGRYLLPPVELGQLRGDEFAALGYVANWRMIFRGSGYFAQTAAPSPLQHTWSLGIEEQFYLLWPLVVVGLLRLRGDIGRVMLFALAVGGAAASAVAAAAWYRPDEVNRAYFGTDSRAQALLIGCALAVVLARGRVGHAASDRRHPWLGALALLGAITVGLLWTQATGTDGWLYHGGLTVAALGVAAVLAHAVVSPGSPTARLLALAPLVWLGRISYGVYLWHWPLFQFVNAERTGLAGAALLWLRLALTVGVAVLSYVLVELPIRRGAAWRRLRTPWRIEAVATALGTVVLVAIVATVSPAAGPGLSASQAITISVPLPTGQAAAGHPAPIRPGGPVPPMQRTGRTPGALPRVDFFGDSVSWTLGTYLPAHPTIEINVHSIQGCGITLLSNILELGAPHTLYPYCPQWPGRWQAGVNADDPDVSVILLDRWEFMDARLDGSYQHVGQPAFDAYLTGQLDEAITIAGSKGAAVVLLTAPYTHRAETPSGGLYPEDQPARVDAWNSLLRAEAAAHPGTVTVLDLNHVVCPGGTFTWSIGGVQVRSDGLHFTPAGVQRWIAPWLLPQVVSLAATGQP
jgi:peptidoglycan/LPS O-acetylase OafA/YrhL